MMRHSRAYCRPLFFMVGLRKPHMDWALPQSFFDRQTPQEGPLRARLRELLNIQSIEIFTWAQLVPKTLNYVALCFCLCSIRDRAAAVGSSGGPCGHAAHRLVELHHRGAVGAQHGRGTRRSDAR